MLICSTLGAATANGATSAYITSLSDALEKNLKGNAEGYSFTISYRNQWVDSRAAGMARTAADAPALNMTADVKFSAASLSKTVTAVSALQLLVPNGSPSLLDAAIGPYLPGDFKPDAAFKAITFRQLLRHKSGIVGNNTNPCAVQNPCDVLYNTLANYVNSHPDVSDKTRKYSNVGYALFRILIPKLANTAPPDNVADPGKAYADAYTEYVQQHIFNPLGLGMLSARSDASTGVNYVFAPPFQPGPGLILGDHAGHLGDLTLENASQGWIMSTQDLGLFQRNLIFGDNILSHALGQQMLGDNCMGYDDCNVGTGGSQFYYSHKSGGYPAFYSGPPQCGFQQGEFNGELVAFTNEISVAVIVNSNLTYDASANKCVLPNGTALKEGSLLSAVVDAFNSTIANYPAVTSLDPSIGPETGSTDVNVYGAGFPGLFDTSHTMNVSFGSVPVAYSKFSTTEFFTRTSGGRGSVYVTVEVDGIRSIPTAGSQFTFAKFPIITSISPSNGPATGGSAVIVSGVNFSPGRGNTVITFDSKPATNVDCTPTLCSATTPAGAGTVQVQVVANLPSVNAARFTFTAVVTSVIPNTGVENGGDKVAISGVGFTSGAPAFGPNRAATWSCPTTSACQAISPAGSGTVDVHYDVDGIPGTTKPAGRFTYTRNLQRGWTQWRLSPPDFSNSGGVVTNDSLRREILYLVAQQGDTDLTYSWSPVSQGWVFRNPLVSPRPSRGAFAFHEMTGKAVLFGGLIDTVQDQGDGITKITYNTDNTTWIWDGVNWSAANTPVSPPARFYASTTYDAAHKKIVLFGGCGRVLHTGGCASPLNDTWTWDGSAWKKESPSVNPSARSQAVMAYDPATSRTMLFGGLTAAGVASDVWVWDGQNWSQEQSAAPGPPARYGGGLGYSPLDSALVLYGGRTYQGNQIVPLDDTWIWNGSSWSQAFPAVTPKMTDEIAGMTYDTALNQVVLIGSDSVWVWGGR
jgi:CubicO group peptidase (beta-lactamase class C family)